MLLDRLKDAVAAVRGTSKTPHVDMRSLISRPGETPDEQDIAIIDPEDFQLNTLINERNYAFRYAAYVEDGFLDKSWVEWFDDHHPCLFHSLDIAEKDGVSSEYGIRMHDLGDALIISFVSHTRTVFFHVWAANSKTTKKYIKLVQDCFKFAKAEEIFDENTLMRTVSFWGAGSHGYTSTDRKVALLKWEDHVEYNYPKKVKAQLEQLQSLHPPVVGGRIILMHGPPGVGKTSLIRTMGMHWTDWCHTSYVIDPEVLLGSSSALMSVITFDFSRYIKGNIKKEDAYHLLVIEDAGELLAKDAGGQGFGRLLNMADGLLAQSTNLLIVITTNKPLEDIHDAVARKGRCLANIHFDAFDRTEAEAWLRHQNPDDADTLIKKLGNATEWTLAELYHIIGSYNQIVAAKKEYVVGTYL